MCGSRENADRRHRKYNTERLRDNYPKTNIKMAVMPIKISIEAIVY